MPRKERRRAPRRDEPTGASLRREIQQLKQQSSEILLRMDELVKALETIEERARMASPKK